MKVLYIGENSGNSRLRFLAMTRLGHDVTIIDPYRALPRGLLFGAWMFRTGSLGLAGYLRSYLRNQYRGQRYDAVYVENGELLGRAAVEDLKKVARSVVNVNRDNPFVQRDGRRWRLFLQALPAYDAFITTRESNVAQAQAAGARNVSRIQSSADEIYHRPQALNPDEKARYAADVAFVGTWMPERGPFMVELIRRGVPLRIYGPRWRKAPEYRELKPFLSDETFLGAQEYAKAISGAKIALALLSEGNEDLHTTRSFEIPAIGAVLMAQRTSEHLEMYHEGEEAVFWSDAAECAEKCLDLLTRPDDLRRIAEAGRSRVIANRGFHEDNCIQILDLATTFARADGD